MTFEESDPVIGRTHAANAATAARGATQRETRGRRHARAVRSQPACCRPARVLTYALLRSSLCERKTGGRRSSRRAPAGRGPVECRPPLSDDGCVEFRILGPLEVVVEGRLVPLDAPKPRALLAMLLLRANESVSRDHLIDELWAGRPPISATKVLQTYVFQLRRTLGREVIGTVSSAYDVRADAGSFDLLRFEQLVA